MIRFAILALALSACGASPLQVAATVTDSAGAALTSAGGEILAHRQTDLTAAATSGSTAVEATAAIAAVQERYRPVVAAEEAAAAVQRSCADAVVAFAAGSKPLAALTSLLPSLVAAWASLVAALAPIGVVLPALPASLASLLPAPTGAP